MEQTHDSRVVQLGIDDVTLEGQLAVPPDAAGLVVLANGQWGVRFGSRETGIADALRQGGFGTLLVELLTPDESADRANRFATGRLAERLAGVTDWLDHRERTEPLERGFLGTGPGAATVVRGVTEHDTGAGAIVLVDACPSLVTEPLEDVPVPVLLVVDESEEHLLRTHRRARKRLGSDRQHHAILRADEATPGTASAEVGSLATTWFETQFGTTD